MFCICWCRKLRATPFACSRWFPLLVGELMGNSKSKGGKLAFEICAVTRDAKNMDATAGNVLVAKIVLHDDMGNCSPPITLERLLRPGLPPGSQVSLILLLYIQFLPLLLMLALVVFLSLPHLNRFPCGTTVHPISPICTLPPSSSVCPPLLC